MINLLPPQDRLAIEVSKRNSILRRYVELGLLSIAILSVLIIGSYYYLRQQEQNTLRTVELNKQKVEELAVVQTEAEDLSRTINTISLLLAKDVKFSTVLTDIGKLMPVGSVLTGLELTGVSSKSPLTISAQVESEQKAAVLRNNLEASDLFAEAQIKAITRNSDEQPSEDEDKEDTESRKYAYTTVIEVYFDSQKSEKPEGSQ